MSHEPIIIQRVINAARATVTGDAKYASAVLALAGFVGHWYFF